MVKDKSDELDKFHIEVSRQLRKRLSCSIDFEDVETVMKTAYEVLAGKDPNHVIWLISAGMAKDMVNRIET